MAKTPDRSHAFTFDEAKFRAATPYPLESTNLPGVFTTPAPARGFDYNTASPRDLIRAGFLWKRPDAASPAAVRAAWDRVMSRTWRPEDRIVPQFEVQTGKPHHPYTPLVKQAEPASSNAQWAGAITSADPEDGQWTSVSASWTIPNVNKPSQEQGTEGGWNSTSWIGCGGGTIPNGSWQAALRAGIQQLVDAQGRASYVAWYQWVGPKRPDSPSYIFQTNITNFPVSPGQEVSCGVQVTGNISFANNATGQHFSITLVRPPGAGAANSVEWIMEAPDRGLPFSSLPRFSPVEFTSALACGTADLASNGHGIAFGDSTIGGPQDGSVLDISSLTLTIVRPNQIVIIFTG
jgi:hypothetical protein